MSMRELVDDTAQGISRRLGLPQKDVGRILTYWIRKSPPDYWEDACQDIALSVLEQQPGNPGLMFAIARHVVGRLWERWHTRHHYGGMSLDAALDDDSGRTLADTIAGAIDYEAQVCGAITCSEMFAKLPDWAKEIVSLRLSGHNVNGRRAAKMRDWANEHASILLA